jgi:hypothetical protein
MYVLDRVTGQVLSANPSRTSPPARASTCRPGKLKYNPAKNPRGRQGHARHLPGLAGRQGLAAVGVVAAHAAAVPAACRTCARTRRARDQLYRRHAVRRRRSIKMYPGPGGHRGEFAAWDPVAGRKVWTIKERFPVWSGALADRRRRGLLRHHGRLVQGGRRAHRQAAVAVQDRLRHHRPAGVLPRPGRQAVHRGAVGRRRLGRRHRRPAISTRATAPAANGLVNATRDLPNYTTKGGMLYVFALP